VTEDPTQLLRELRLRVTPQRRAILGAFHDRPDEHLSADEVHSRASLTVPEIGRGTVYATLAELAEIRLLASVGSAEPVRYETNIAPHDHFRCRLCLRLFDVDLGAGGPLPELDGYVVERVATIAEGICSECRFYARGLGDGAAAMLDSRQIDDDLLGTLACSVAKTPLGDVALAASSAGAVRLAFEDHADFELLIGRARSRRGGRSASGRADRLSRLLEDYFAGGRNPSTDEVDWSRAEEATSGALEATRQIPYGTPRSYERLGVEVEAYTCGYAMGANPVPVMLPCHRVSCGSDRPELWVGGSARLALVRRFESESLAGTDGR
jgi:Fe2+ or Zn2+ uptake regulation protein/O6-methylguanine-DNA--protein-cysteine methyltransferase